MVEQPYGEAEIEPGSVLAAALGRAEAERRRKAGEYDNEATEEYMADLGGRIGDEGFEKMSREELTLWGKIKAKVQQFLDQFLRGLRIAKGIVLSDKDLSYILFKSWKHAREAKSGHAGRGIFAEAEDVVRSQGTRFCEGVRNPGWKDKAQALTDTKKSPEGKTIAHEDSLSHAEAPRYVPSLPKIFDAKLTRISENLKLLEETEVLVYHWSGIMFFAHGGSSATYIFSSFPLLRRN